jgi:ribose 5-phosphate isomerase B
LCCGSGVGAAIAANKMKGVYASICHDTYSAAQGVLHDDMNVLCLGGRVIGPELAKVLIPAFLNAEYQGNKRAGRGWREGGEDTQNGRWSIRWLSISEPG